jgi:hypothetical protein
MSVVDDLMATQACGRAAVGVTSGLTSFFFFYSRTWSLRPPVASRNPINQFMLYLSAFVTFQSAVSYSQNCY